MLSLSKLRKLTDEVPQIKLIIKISSWKPLAVPVVSRVGQVGTKW